MSQIVGHISQSPDGGLFYIFRGKTGKTAARFILS